VMAITDMNEATVESMRYTPYGEMTITRNGTPQSSDPLGQHVSYTGRWFDEESGLYYYRARAYDPVKGRFLERDPLGYAAGANLFEYARTNPITSVDPLGQEPYDPKSSDPKHKRVTQALEMIRIAGPAWAKTLLEKGDPKIDIRDMERPPGAVRVFGMCDIPKGENGMLHFNEIVIDTATAERAWGDPWDLLLQKLLHELRHLSEFKKHANKDGEAPPSAVPTHKDPVPGSGIPASSSEEAGRSKWDDADERESEETYDEWKRIQQEEKEFREAGFGDGPPRRPDGSNPHDNEA
jgi:RHS repeat-associated protein